MPPKPKTLTEEQVKQIREATSYGKAADALGISQERAKAIKGAHTLEQAMKIAAPEKDKLKPRKVTKREEEKVMEVLNEASMKPGVTEASPRETPETPKLQPGVKPGESKLQPGVTLEAPETPEIPAVPKLQPDEYDYHALIPAEIVGKGIPIKVTLSVRTLAYYQIASTTDNKLVLGDFLDDCANDTFEGRGYSLGLVKKGA